MSGFGPPPGAPAEDAHRRPPSYLPPGGLAPVQGPPPGMPGEAFPEALAAPGSGPSSTAYQRRPAVRRGTTHALMATAHKPGIIPLRPMSTGDLLDGAVKHFRRNPGPVAGLALLVLAVAVIPATLLAGLAMVGTWYTDLGLVTVFGVETFSSLLLAVGVGFAALILCGLLAHSVAEATLGRKAQLPELWAAGKRRLLPLVGLQLITLALLLGPVLILVLVVALASDSGALTLAIIGVLGTIVLVAWSAFVTSRTLLAGPALVLEKLGVRAALRRGWALSAGSFWRIVWTSFVVGTMAFIVFWVIQLPLTLLLQVFTLFVDLTPSVESFVSALVVCLATLGAGSVVIPFVAGANCLLYVDQRMRKEGFDLVLLRAATSAPGGRR